MRRIPLLRTLAGLALVGVLLVGARMIVADDKPKEDPKKDDVKKDDVKKQDDKKPEPKVEEPDLKKQLEQMRKEFADLKAEMKKMMEDMRRGGPGFRPFPDNFPNRPVRPQARFGVGMERPSEAMADQLGLDKNTGLVVTDVVPDSVAEKAGVKLHDVLVEFNGKAVPNDIPDFLRMIQDAKADMPFSVTVIRKGKKETIKDVTLPAIKRQSRGDLRPVPRGEPVLVFGPACR